jgi:hypothetical protein
MLSIAYVLRNRVAAGFAETPYLACITLPEMQPGIEIEGDLPFPDTRHPDFFILIQKLDDVLQGRVKDITGGALYYHRESVRCVPASTGRDRVSALKDLTFYR